MPGDRGVVARREGRRAGRLSRNTITRVQRAYLASTRAFSLLLMVIGPAMVVATLARGGGVLALGVVMGVLFTLLGAGRFWLAGGRGR